jgi:glycerol-3-phosphate dehydrogenase
VTVEPYDVAVVGAGVIGAGIAARLSQDDLRVIWLEAAHDVAEGATKGNSAIAASGYDVEPGTLEAELVTASSRRWEAICADLDVPFRRVGCLVLAFTAAEERRLADLRAQAAANGVETAVVSGGRLGTLAPAASAAARAALHVPAEGIVDPIRLTIAWAELAVRNGVDLHLGTPARGFRRDDSGRIVAVETPRGAIPARFVVNAAGLRADEVSAMAGGEAFRIWPRKGQFLLVDRAAAAGVRHILAPIPGPDTRGTLVIPTTNGSLLLGPTAEDGEDKTDASTDAATLARVFAAANRLLAAPVDRAHVTKAFAGLRPASDHLYRVERSTPVPNLVHAAAIRSTGVSSSPAVADRVRDVLVEAGLEARPRPGAVTRLERRARLAELPSGDVVTAPDPDGTARTVVCSCEHVTAAEIRAALTGPVPATSIDGVRKRTRACAGRCQGSYCLAGVGFMLSVERGLEPWQVEHGEPGSTWGIG